MILQYQRHIKRHFMLLENLFPGVADNSPDWLTLIIKKHKLAIVNE